MAFMGGGNGPAANVGGDLIKEASEATFAASVLEASTEAVVLVDFWAPWCGPCKQLPPALEAAVNEAGGKVRLVKINVDENQQIAAQMHVQPIPAMFAFKDGQPVDGFMGALPPSQLKTFIDGVVGKADGGVGDQIAELLEMAKAALAGGQPEQSVQVYAAIMQQEPTNVAALAGLAKIHVALKELDLAREVLGMVPEDAANDPAIEAARAALNLAEDMAHIGDPNEPAAKVEANPADHATRFDLAKAMLALDDRDAAVDHLLEIVKRDRAREDNAARKQLLSLFEIWGPQDPITAQARQKLSIALFS